MALTAADVAAIWNYKPTGAKYTAYQYLTNASNASDTTKSIVTTIAAVQTAVGKVDTEVQSLGPNSVAMAKFIADFQAAGAVDASQALHDLIEQAVLDALKKGTE